MHSMHFLSLDTDHEQAADNTTTTTTMAIWMPLLVACSFAPAKRSVIGAFVKDFSVPAISLSPHHVGVVGVGVSVNSTTDSQPEQERYWPAISGIFLVVVIVVVITE